MLRQSTTDRNVAPRFAGASVVLASVLCVFAASTPSFAIPTLFVKELTNNSDEAVDGLQGQFSNSQGVDLLNHYDGESGSKFDNFSVLDTGDVIDVTWSNYNDGDNNLLDIGESVTIGLSTDNETENEFLFWTVGFGGGCGSCAIFQAGIGGIAMPPGVLGEPVTPAVNITNKNIPPGGSPEPLLISNIRAAAFTTPWDLSEMNSDNPILNAALAPLSTGSIILNPGDSSTLVLPPTPVGMHAVLTYDVTATVSGGTLRDFAQFNVVPEPSGLLVALIGIVGLARGWCKREKRRATILLSGEG